MQATNQRYTQPYILAEKGDFMKMSDRTYNFLKWFALIAIPAFNVFILTLGKIWGFPYYAEIGATVAAVGVLIAALIGSSSAAYYNDVDEDDEDDEDWDEDQSQLMGGE